MRLMLAITLAFSAAGLLAAQAPVTYKARLGIAPVDASNQPFVSGSGSVTAVLTGNRLAVSGTFAGLVTSATVARIHVGPKGIRGPAQIALTVTRDRSGTVESVVTLTAAQVDHLKRGRLYVQIDSEKAPEGNLWGWLLE
jgi:hypothetical protein